MGEVIKRLAFGIEVKYSIDGFEYQTFIDDSDYVELEQDDE